MDPEHQTSGSSRVFGLQDKRRLKKQHGETLVPTLGQTGPVWFITVFVLITNKPWSTQLMGGSTNTICNWAKSLSRHQNHPTHLFFLGLPNPSVFLGKVLTHNTEPVQQRGPGEPAFYTRTDQNQDVRWNFTFRKPAFRTREVHAVTSTVLCSNDPHFLLLPHSTMGNEVHITERSYIFQTPDIYNLLKQQRRCHDDDSIHSQR